MKVVLSDELFVNTFDFLLKKQKKLS
jgi:hypothetical protein